MMRTPHDPQFVVEKDRFVLRHCCEDCAFFQPHEGVLRCAHEWPNREHLRAHYEQAPFSIVFCKEFELR